MRVAIAFLAAILTLQAADDRQLVLAAKSQADFERVEAAPSPQPQDTTACIQSQASALPGALPEDRSLILFRKGYCTLAGASISRDPAEFETAAASFDEAIESWPARSAAAVKRKLPPPPIPAVLRVFDAVARLEQNAGLDPFGSQEARLATAVERPNCESEIVGWGSCQSVVQLGNIWLGWIAWQRGEAAAAARRFAGMTFTGWPQWVEGQEAFRTGDYKTASLHYGEAVALWQAAQRDQALTLIRRLDPRPEIGAMLIDFGEAQLLAGDASAAIATFDAAVRADSSKARAIYLRARAKETAGQKNAAMDDYNLASRTAFATAAGHSSGEAHLYQGILLYQRKDWPRAENEFADALNFEIAPAMKSDAAAWRHLAAVAGGSCGASREYLEHSLAGVSPDFPKDDARSALAACSASESAASHVVLPRAK